MDLTRLSFFLSIALVVISGCNNRETRQSSTRFDGSSLKSPRAAFHIVQLLDSGRTDSAKAFLRTASLDETLRHNVLVAMQGGNAKQAGDLLNQYLDLWMISRLTDARPEPFPATTDDPELINLLVKLAIHRQEYPSEQVHGEAIVAISSIFRMARQGQTEKIENSHSPDAEEQD